MGERVAELETFADSVADEGLDAVVLLGMGGSSLAPEVLRRTFRVESFHVLDTTHPAAIRAVESAIDLERTLFVSASKSGGTLETRSHTDYFWERTGKRGAAFVAITDPGSEPRAHGGRARLPARLHRRADDRRPLLRALAVRDRARGADGRRRRAPARERRPDGRRVPARRRQPRLRARPPVRHRLARGPRQDLHRGHRGRLRALGGAADRRVDRQAGQGARARAGRVARTAPTARPRSRRSPTRTRSAASSSAGSSPSPSPASSSRSTRSTSPTCRPRRTRRTRCSRPARSPTSSRRARSTSCSRRRTSATTSACRRSSSRTPRTTAGSTISSASCAAAAASSSRTATGRATCTRPGQLHKGGPNTGLFLQVVDDPGEEIPIPGKPFGFRRLLRAQAAGDYASLQERGRRVARIHIEEA